MQPEPLLSTTKLKGAVLIVDDDEGVRKVLTRWTESLGYQVRAAGNADEALDALRRGTVDVALCDVRMPGHDGIWLMDQMRRNYPHTSIVLATGLTELDPIITLRPGVVGYIVKPFDREELDAVIQRGLAARIERSAAAPRRMLLPESTPHTAATEPVPARRRLIEGVVEGIVIARYS